MPGYLTRCREEVDAALEGYMPRPEGHAGGLIEAMRHSLFAGGKRLRPILLLAACEAVGGEFFGAMPFACAMEYIHTYSLIHDDLPAMDDDDLRRGVPTCHRVFGEARAILAGDALLTEAAVMCLRPESVAALGAWRVIEATRVIFEAAGFMGMVAGQDVDVASEGRPVGLEVVEFIHAHKTGSLIMASVKAGGILGGGAGNQVEALEIYGRSVGLAFQITDDVLDLEGDETRLGKAVGADLNRGKATYPAQVGIDRSKRAAGELIDRGVEALAPLGEAAYALRAMAEYIVERRY